MGCKRRGCSTKIHAHAPCTSTCTLRHLSLWEERSPLKINIHGRQGFGGVAITDAREVGIRRLRHRKPPPANGGSGTSLVARMRWMARRERERVFGGLSLELQTRRRHLFVPKANRRAVFFEFDGEKHPSVCTGFLEKLVRM